MSCADKNGRENLGRNVRIGKIFRGRSEDVRGLTQSIIQIDTHTLAFSHLHFTNQAVAARRAATACHSISSTLVRVR